MNENFPSFGRTLDFKNLDSNQYLKQSLVNIVNPNLIV